MTLHLISGTPDPPQAGQKLTICYDFSKVEATSVELSVEFDPPSGSVSVHLTAAVPCADVNVPSGAGDVLVVDQSGASAAWARIVV